MNNITRSNYVSRFILAVVLCIIFVLTWIFLSYFEVVQASIEALSVDVNLIHMKQMLRAQNDIAEKQATSSCLVLDNPRLFPINSSQLDAQSNVSESAKVIPGTWHYDAKKHQLTYFVFSKSYFRSEFGQKIIVNLYCKGGQILFKEEAHQWCRDKKIWGCSAW